MYFLKPRKDVVPYNLDFEEHAQTFLVVVEQLVQIDPYHVHGAQICILAEALDDILVNDVLDLLDHHEHILLVLLNEVLVEQLGLVLLLHGGQVLRKVKEVLLLQSGLQILGTLDFGVFLLGYQTFQVQVHFRKLTVKPQLLDDRLLIKAGLYLDLLTLGTNFGNKEHV